MYNDKNGRLGHGYGAVGLTFPEAMVGEQRGDDDTPRLDTQIGGRRCDGSMPDDHTGNSVRNGGKTTGWGLREHPLAMVYSPYQIYRELYSPDVALTRGTLFTELDLPFEGSNKNGGC